MEAGGVIGAWTAARTGDGGLIRRGRLTLLDDRLVFAPEAGDPELTLPIGAIAYVEVLGRGSLFKPPQVRLHIAGNRHLDLGILFSPTTPNASEKNREAFDDFVAKLPVPVR